MHPSKALLDIFCVDYLSKDENWFQNPFVARSRQLVAVSILGAIGHMNLRTDINPRYLVRLAIVGLMCTGMCLYCIKDGVVTWPNQRKYALEFQEYSKIHADLDEKERADKWNEGAIASHGWKSDLLKKPRTKYDINGQFAMAAVAGLIGLIFLTKLLSNRKRWIEADEKRLRSSQKREVALDAISALDKKKWANKGIAKVLFQTNGKNREIVLDDCNYDRDTTQAILRHVEANIDHAKIINGKPEPPPKPAAELEAKS